MLARIRRPGITRRRPDRSVRMRSEHRPTVAPDQRKNRRCDPKPLGQMRTSRALHNPVDDGQPMLQCGTYRALDSRGLPHVSDRGSPTETPPRRRVGTAGAPRTVRAMITGEQQHVR